MLEFASRRVSVFNLIPPYEYVQRVYEKEVHRYLHCERNEIKHWVIVGGYLGHEIAQILRSYPQCHVTVFECSERYVKKLQKRFRNSNRVTIVEKAVTDRVGKLDFYETNLRGSGSVLQVGQLATKSYGMVNAEHQIVESITLDEYFKGKKIDVLQMDVQGAEALVLAGAGNVISTCRAIFTEISIFKDLYSGAATMDELNVIFEKAGYQIISLGTDFNLTGNALYLKFENNNVYD